GYLSDLGLMEDRVAHYYIPHHRAHAASAFRLSGLEEACVFTVDGKGDGLCGTVYRGHRDGRMELLRSSPSKDSLGSFYQAATEALGFIPVDGEYKTMGLAALASGNGAVNPFKSIVSVEEGLFKSSIRWKFRSFNEHNPSKTVPNPLSSVAQTEDFKKVLEGMPREQFAYFAQEHCEENMLNFARDAMRITGINDIAAAGGVMLNVKANALIRDELNPSSFFVFPDSADGGLAAGAAMEALYQARALSGQIRFRDPYLGHSFSDEAILDSIEAYRGKHGLNVTEATPGPVADYLAQGKVLGTFQGRLEMGPRALGNRSVLADPRSDSAKDRINLLLKGREWFVPFAPALLEEDANLYWDGSVDYRYMTFAVKASKYAREVVPAVVHVDGTMRPEVVSRDYNPWLYDVLSEFKKRTGVGVLLNTSFNRHGLPIVGSPADALDHLINGWVDGLSIGRWYVERA
ncbi:MAG: carbamoyltransferase C-terminal domain-containing protein, partial [Pyrinomonadaceae bacterium]